MNNNHPKRKKDILNNYELFFNENGYYISFKDGENSLRHLEVSKDIYDLFNTFELDDISYLNEVSRHYEHSELTPQTLHERTLFKESSIEDDVMKNMQYMDLYNAIYRLPEIQKHRLILYYFYGLTFEEIAKIDGCTKRAVKFSVDIACNKLRDVLDWVEK